MTQEDRHTKSDGSQTQTEPLVDIVPNSARARLINLEQRVTQINKPTTTLTYKLDMPRSPDLQLCETGP